MLRTFRVGKSKEKTWERHSLQFQVLIPSNFERVSLSLHKHFTPVSQIACAEMSLLHADLTHHWRGWAEKHESGNSTRKCTCAVTPPAIYGSWQWTLSNLICEWLCLTCHLFLVTVWSINITMSNKEKLTNTGRCIKNVKDVHVTIQLH